MFDERNQADFAGLVQLTAAVRHKDGPKNHALWRMHPERWLEAVATDSIAALDWRLRTDCVYRQVPAFSASDRAMIDVLAMTHENRLAVIELKADEDIHLPLQGLDYWARVEWHRSRGEFERFGYFPGYEIAPAKPLLMLVAPALHVHPTTDVLLRYLSPEIDGRGISGARAPLAKTCHGWASSRDLSFDLARPQIPILLRSMTSCPRW